MKRELRDKWVADLRANGDRQSQTFLSCNKGECCLGRLALLEGVAHRTIPNVSDDLRMEVERFDFGSGFNEASSYFPARSWLEDRGLPEKMASSLSSMNDDGTSFARIADWIEQNVPIED